jgi:hypothetical protein
MPLGLSGDGETVLAAASDSYLSPYYRLETVPFAG